MSLSELKTNPTFMQANQSNHPTQPGESRGQDAIRFSDRLLINQSLPFMMERARRLAEGRLFVSRATRLGVAVVAATLFLHVAAQAQTLWKDPQARSMVSDRRARAVGDLLTIVVQENNTASKDNSTKSSKSSSIDASLDTVLFSPTASGFLTKGGKLPALKTSAAQSFDGGGKIKNEEKITARIAVRVVDVLPNGNLVIEGRRTTSFAGETQEAVLRGVVRGEDVAPNNSVFSYNVADATIRYISKGSVSDPQRKGWFLRVWDKVTPF